MQQANASPEELREYAERSNQEKLSISLRMLDRYMAYTPRKGDRQDPRPTQSPGGLPRSNRSLRSDDENAIVEVLDQITLFVVTGRPGEVVSAVFTDFSQAQVRLSANGVPSSAQRQHTEAFFTLLRATRRENVVENRVRLRKMIYTFCAQTIKVRMWKIWKSLYGDRDTMKELEQAIENLEKEDETPVSESVVPGYQNLGLVYSNINISDLLPSQLVRQMVGDLYTQAGKWKEVNNIIVPDDDEIQRTCLLAHILGVSRVMISQHISIRKLVSRLMKLGRFWHGILSLMDWAIQCHEERKSIQYSWIPEGTQSHKRMRAFKLGTRPEVVVEYLANSRSPNVPLNDIDWKVLKAIFHGWNSGELVHPVLHCEVAIIMAYLDHDKQKMPRIITCNKRSCFTCQKWIDLFNQIRRTRWSTLGSHMKYYMQWQFPGTVVANPIFDEVDEALLKLVEDEAFNYLVRGKITQDLPAMQSDDDASLPSGSPKTDIAFSIAP
ncbi:hypothetical protein GLOTRDRAFT_93902 [Gloeophyllum trabeum ATCC 11539]|uniref:Uncharacterized protein n=1 Tax=Gloeophyllum trabeum (strain ATCC 11539 / FP-39264 / Madison 617) TaxID=670483 RepID=S7Q7M0_GLOTA|nr:uncharacterized protein GLOTRDRAFT_93902 [Gloeophyllum trabeum ATCC 11539]EPQ55468.1 hypothetical protein GLOTRDRAFT_93902 [Gloeophyllum trabeum ATCC 11539]